MPEVGYRLRIRLKTTSLLGGFILVNLPYGLPKAALSSSGI